MRQAAKSEPETKLPAARIGWKLPVFASIASGLLFWISFWLPALVWIAAVPLGLSVRMEARRTYLYLGAWLGGLAFFLPGVHWLSFCDPQAWLGWLLLATYLSLYFPAFLFLARVLNRRWAVPLIFAMPAAWVALEYVRMHALSGFGWLFLAHSIYRWTWTIQIADFSGVYGVSFLIALVNAFFVELLTQPLFDRTPKGLALSRAMLWRSCIAFLALLLAELYGIARVMSAPATKGPRVILVQTNLPQSLKDGDAQRSLDHLLDVTKLAKGLPADMIVWPETSYPYMYGDIGPGLSDLEIDRLRIERRSHVAANLKPSENYGKELRQAIQGNRLALFDIAAELRVPILVGVLRNDFRAGRHRHYNSSVLVDFRGPAAVYDKLHLVPFGEYLPLEDWMPFLKILMPYEANVDFGLDHAADYQTLHYGKLHFASLICFEDTIPDLAREFMRRQTPDQPVQFFVNQSNDGWFRGSVESDYHLAASIFRCVECRRPMARVSNIGITALIDGNGRIAKGGQLPKKAENILQGDIYLDGRDSLYVLWGDWLPAGCILLCATGLIFSAARQFHRIRERLSNPRRTGSA